MAKTLVFWRASFDDLVCKHFTGMFPGGGKVPLHPRFFKQQLSNKSTFSSTIVR
jgi:hypothetical protein